MQPHFIITRPLENCSNLKERLPPSNTVSYLPVMQYVEIGNILLIEHPKEYDYIITSQYAAGMIAKYNFAPKSLYYCVGRTTAEILNSQNYTTLSPLTAHAKELINLIKEKHKSSRPLLYLCGETIKYNIHEQLLKNHITCQKLTVYKTLPTNPNLKDILNLKITKSIVFYSKQSYDLFMKAVQDRNMLDALNACNATWVLPKIVAKKAKDYTDITQWKYVRVVHSTHDLINMIHKERTYESS